MESELLEENKVMTAKEAIYTGEGKRRREGGKMMITRQEDGSCDRRPSQPTHSRHRWRPF